jgi:hypothetical protein
MRKGRLVRDYFRKIRRKGRVELHGHLVEEHSRQRTASAKALG